jgi:hypothetical protein
MPEGDNNPARPTWRLHRGGDAVAWRARKAAEEAVSRENRLAAATTTTPFDPREVLAARTAEQLQGDVLTPERRQRLSRLASRIGVRPFDANLVIAVVQDRARRGESIDDLRSALQMLEHTGESAAVRTAQWWMRPLVALAAASMIVFALARWLMAP